MKKDRHEAILALIGKYEIGTQGELAEYLNREGYQVTQATVSRDIRKLNLSKIPGSDGRSRYAASPVGGQVLAEKYVKVLREGMISMAEAGNLLVIRTMSGMAMAVAAALDDMKIRELLGCIAGDDTIMCAMRDEEDVAKVKKKIEKIL